MDLTPATVDEARREYPEVQPLSAVESEHAEMLPETFESGDFGRRTAEWVVQWYYRRFLGGFPDADRREREAAYGENSYEAVHDAIDGAIDAETSAEKLDHLTALDGVDVPVGSAFLAFSHPDRYVVVGRREWSVLHEAGDLDEPYPDPPSVPEYERYRSACRTVADRCEVNLWGLYRALWVLGSD